MAKIADTDTNQKHTKGLSKMLGTYTDLETPENTSSNINDIGAKQFVRSFLLRALSDLKPLDQSSQHTVKHKVQWGARMREAREARRSAARWFFKSDCYEFPLHLRQVCSALNLNYMDVIIKAKRIYKGIDTFTYT